MLKASLQKAVELSGGQVALAKAICSHNSKSKVKQAHVWQWLNVSKEPVPPAEYVIPIALAVGWQVTPHDLRPDIYPNPSDGMPRSLCACVASGLVPTGLENKGAA